MEKSKVYFTDFRAKPGYNLLQKLEKLSKKAGIEKIDFKLNVINEKEKDLEQIFNSFLKPFDLSKAPLFRAELHVFSDNSAALFIDIHHIICDGESISLFVNEFVSSVPKSSIINKSHSNKFS